MHNPPLILLVDDDPHIRDVVRFSLQKSGFHTIEAANGLEALARVNEFQPDLIILDILMPELDGLEVCRRLRSGGARSPLPIVFLSSRDEELDRILGLEMGGDDYVTKPFSPRELVARARAVLRRFSPPPILQATPATPATQAPVLTERSVVPEATRPASSTANKVASPELENRLRHHRLTLDLDRCVAYWENTEVILTATELGILKALLRHPGRVLSREALMDAIYDGEVVVSDRTIDSHIRRVRKKFEPFGGDPIQTLHGMGYRLSEC